MTNFINKSLILIVILLCQTPIFSQFALKNDLNPSQELPLKWRSRIGITFPTSTILTEEDSLLIGSSSTLTGQSTRLNDGGVLLLDPATGKTRQNLSSPKAPIDAVGIAYSKRLVYVTTLTNSLVALTMLGDTLWEIPLGSTCEHAPVLTDLDMDDILDVVIGTDNGLLTAYNGKSGAQLWQFEADFKPKFTYPDKRSFQAAPSIIDLTGDGIGDIIAPNRNGVLYAINGRDGRVIWEVNTQEKSGIIAAPYVTKNMITIAAGATVYQIDLSGNVLSKKSIGKHGIEGIELTPVPINNRLVVATNWASDSNGIWIMGPTLTKPIFVELGPILMPPTVGHILSPQTEHILVFTMDKKIILLDQEGTKVGVFKLPRRATSFPFIEDTNKDGQLELLFNSEDGYLRCYELPTPVEASVWNGLRSNSQNTGAEHSAPVKKRPDTSPQTQILKYIKTSTDTEEQTNQENKIAVNRIGPVRLGMTLEVLKDLFPNAVFDKSTKLGYQSIDIVDDGEELMSLLFPTWKKLTGSDRITMIVTFNPKFKTNEGIGPKTPIELTTQLYGSPYLVRPNKDAQFETIKYPNISASKYWFGAKKGTAEFDEAKPFKKSYTYPQDAQIEFIGIK